MRRTIIGLGAVWLMTLPVASVAAEKCGQVAGDTAALETAWTVITAQCGCAPAASEVGWRAEFKTFVTCARLAALQSVSSGAIRSKCKSTLIAGAKRSTCGHPPSWTTCCYTNRKDRRTCKLRPTSAKCASTTAKFAEPGSSETCLNACADAAGPACWLDQECDDADPCTNDWCEPADGCRHSGIPGCGEVTPPGEGGTACNGNGSTTHGLSAEENTLLQLVNDRRTSRGRTPVTICRSLTVSTQDHANEMRDYGYFSHDGQNGSAFWERACTAGYTNGCVPNTWMGEIIAHSDSTAQGVMNQWTSSPSHQSILEGSNYIVAGIGHACGGPAGHYWVMDLAGADEPSCD